MRFQIADEQRNELRALLGAKDLWFLGDVVDLIMTRFSVEYSERQMRRILKGFGMELAKPYHIDYRKPKNADEKLKKPVK